MTIGEFKRTVLATRAPLPNSVEVVSKSSPDWSFLLSSSVDGVEFVMRRHMLEKINKDMSKFK